MSRVGARLLDITQNNLEKLRVLDGTIWEKHTRMKKSLISILNQKEKMNLEHLFNIVLDYSNNKIKS